jgi:hypothetical protein
MKKGTNADKYCIIRARIPHLPHRLFQMPLVKTGKVNSWTGVGCSRRTGQGPQLILG